MLHVISNDQNQIKALHTIFNSVNLPLHQYASTSSFLNQLNENFTGSIVLDVNSTKVAPLDFLNHLIQLQCKIPVIIITDINDIQVAIEAMKLGAKEFILKPYNDQLLLESVQKNNKNNLRAWQVNYKITQLSQREKEILFLIIEGNLNRVIASQLGLSISTVEAHRRNIMKKLKVKSKAQLIRTCIEAEGIQAISF